MDSQHHIAFEPSPKRVRVMANGKTVADSLAAVLVLETGHAPVYYFPRNDVRLDLLQPSNRRSHCPYKGDASYWSLKIGRRTIENAVWSYEQPVGGAERIAGHLAFYWDKVDHWFEEDEEIFGHPRDPHHRVDVRPSSRTVRVTLAGQTVARTRRALCLFETGMPTRYYFPPDDVHGEFLIPSPTATICPYKGQASYRSLKVGDRIAEDAVWVYEAPLPECPRIKGHLCFDPKKVDGLEVEGDTG